MPTMDFDEEPEKLVLCVIFYRDNSSLDSYRYPTYLLNKKLKDISPYWIEKIVVAPKLWKVLYDS